MPDAIVTSMAGPTLRLPVPADPPPRPGPAERPRRWNPIPAALLACTLLLTAGCTGNVTPPPTSPLPSNPSTPTLTSTPTPTPTPTSARERALVDTKQAYIDFTRALDQFGQAGGGTVIPDYLDELIHPNSPAADYVLEEMSTVRREKLKSTGFGTLRNFSLLKSSDLSASPPEVHWSACLDQTKVEVTQSGKPYLEKPDFLAELAVVKLDRVHMKWRVWDLDVHLATPGSNCGGS